MSSLTQGVGAPAGESWPLKLAAKLEALLAPHVRVTVENFARGGCSTPCWVNQAEFFAKMRDDPPDLLVVEMVVDASMLEPAALAPLYEDFVDDLRTLAVPLLFWTGFLLPHGGGKSPARFYENGLVQEGVLLARNLSFFSFRLLAWPERRKWL